MPWRDCFLRDVPLLIFDEGTLALDTISERRVQQALAVAREVRTVILVAHRLSTLLDCDRILVFDGGKIVETGSYKELLEKRGAFYELSLTAQAPMRVTAPANGEPALAATCIKNQEAARPRSLERAPAAWLVVPCSGQPHALGGVSGGLAGVSAAGGGVAGASEVGAGGVWGAGAGSVTRGAGTGACAFLALVSPSLSSSMKAVLPASPRRR